MAYLSQITSVEGMLKHLELRVGEAGEHWSQSLMFCSLGILDDKSL